MMPKPSVWEGWEAKCESDRPMGVGYFVLNSDLNDSVVSENIGIDLFKGMTRNKKRRAK